MPEVSSAAVLKQVLKDISKVQGIIDGSSTLTKALKKDGLEKDELNRIVEKTRTLIEKLKTEVNRISEYFSEIGENVAVEKEEEEGGEGARVPADGASVSLNGDIGSDDTNESSSHLNGDVNPEEHSCEDTMQEKTTNQGEGNKEEEAVTGSAEETAKNFDSTNNGNLEKNSDKLGDNSEKPSDNLEEDSSDNLVEGSADNLKGSLAGNVEKGTADNLEKGTAVNLEKDSADNLEKGTADNLGKGTADNLGKGTADNLEKGTADNLEKGSAGNSKEGTADNLTKGSADNLGNASADNLEKASADNFEEDSVDNLEAGSADNLEEDSADNLGEESVARTDAEVTTPTKETESAGRPEEVSSESNGGYDEKQEQGTWKIKCVDINKLINPHLLSAKKAAAGNGGDHVGADESVVVLSDSDAEANPGGKKKSTQLENLLRANELVVERIKKNINITLTRQSKAVIVLDDSDSSDEVALSKIVRDRLNKPLENNKKPNNEGKVQDKKRKSVRFNVSDEDEQDSRKIKMRSRKAKKKHVYSSSDSETNETKVKKKQRKKQPRDLASVSSFSDTNTDSDSDGDKQKKSKKKTQSKESSAALEKRLISSQTDDKFSWRSYVSLTKVAADKLKENYEKRLLKDEINRLTNLDSLKRTHRAAKGSQSSDSADSVSVKKQRVRKSKDVEKKGANSSSSDKSDCEVQQPIEDPLALPEESEQISTLADKEDDVINTVLSGINSGSESSAHENEGADSKESDAEQNENGSKKKDDEEEKKKDDKEEKEKNDKKEKKKDDEEEKKTDEEKAKQKEDGSAGAVKDKDKGWRKDRLLTEKLSESDSDEQFSKFLEKKKQLEELHSDTEDLTTKAKKITKRTGKRKVRIVNSDSDSSCQVVSNDDDNNSDKELAESSDSSVQTEKTKNRKRRRIKAIQDSSDDEENDEKSTRKNIRKVWANDSLAETTKQAEKEEQERKTRIAERQKKYNHLFNDDELQDAKVDKVVLDFNEETNKKLLQVDRHIVKHLKPHQAKGIQFMWTACFESLERAKNTKGSGCILAHCMGLGKTLQVVALTHALLSKAEETGVSKVLVVTPLNTVLNWVAEFKKWLPNEDDIEVYELVSYKQNYERQYEVQQWSKNGGVLIVGYDMFRNLTNPTNKRLNKKMRNGFYSALVDPGPDLVVCDEGHLLKNEKTSLSVAMNRLRTLRRIVLTGTPLQNNLKEYFCMVQFVKPNLLGTYKEYLNRFVNPITNGQYTDSTQHDIQVMRKRSHVLHKLLDGIVQRRDYAVLAPFLPPKHEYVLFISLTEVQIKLYEHYLRDKAQIRTSSKGKSYLFIDFQEFLRICTHPRVLKTRPKKQDLLDDDEDSEGSLKEFIDDREESTSSSSSSDSKSGSASENESAPKPPTQSKRLTRSNADQIVLSDTEDVANPSDPSEWWSQYCQNDEMECLNHSGKLFLLFEILHECEQIGDKILVFSQSLYSLDVIEYFLGKVDEATQAEKSDTSAVGGHPGSWSLGLDYFRLDGSSSCDNRASWCKTFNDPENTRARLFLISTRAGGLGINLVAANRVIIFDVSWNPSHDVQSIYRVYRFGQVKPCYVYRFVTLGTMEMKIYERQVIKQAISKRVIDEQQIDRHYTQNDLTELYKFEPKPDEDRPTPLVPKDVLLGELLQKFNDRIYKYHEHQSLLENKEEEGLNEDERKAAWEEFEYEKKARQFPNVLNNIPIQTVVLALTSIIQKDNPTWDNGAVQSIVPQLVKELEQQLQFGNMSMYNRILNEVRLMQSAKQQQRLQEYYYRQQQQALMMRQFQMLKQNSAQYPTGTLPFNNPRAFNPGPSATTPMTSEVIDLND